MGDGIAKLAAKYDRVLVWGHIGLLESFARYSYLPICLSLSLWYVCLYACSMYIYIHIYIYTWTHTSWLYLFCHIHIEVYACIHIHLHMDVYVGCLRGETHSRHGAFGLAVGLTSTAKSCCRLQIECLQGFVDGFSTYQQWGLYEDDSRAQQALDDLDEHSLFFLAYLVQSLLGQGGWSTRGLHSTNLLTSSC